MKYLITPYTGIEELSYEVSMAVSAALFRRGEMIFSPIMHCHEMARRHTMPKGYDFWEEYNRHMLRRSSEAYCVQLDGWLGSDGVAGELKYCQYQEKQVTFITVERVKMDTFKQGKKEYSDIIAKGWSNLIFSDSSIDQVLTNLIVPNIIFGEVTV